MKKRMLLLVVVVAWGLAVLARLKFNGLVYGFDFGLFQPDGTHYATQALGLMGKDPIIASQEISNWYSTHSFKMQGLSAQEVIDQKVFYPPGRILYPLLSAPFVKLIGIPGMLVVPIISFLVLMLSVFFLGQKFNRIELGTTLAITLSISPTVLRWMISDGSDALFVALISLLPLVLDLKRPNLRLAAFTFLILTSSLTRFSLPIFLGIAAVLFIQKLFKDSIFIILVSFLSNLPALSVTDRLFLGRTDASFVEKLFQLPASALKVAFIEVAELAVLDRLLLLFLFCALILAITNLRKISSQYFFAIALSVWALGAINGTLGVNFRYQLPVLVFCSWVILENLPRIFLDRKTLSDGQSRIV